MTNSQTDSATWPELAEGLYGFLTGRGATIEYELDKLEIRVPQNAADDGGDQAARLLVAEPGARGS